MAAAGLRAELLECRLAPMREAPAAACAQAGAFPCRIKIIKALSWRAWTTGRRHCARDYERLPAHHAAWVEWAAIIQMTRRLAKTPAG